MLPVERCQWFALVALALLVVELFVPERAWRLRLPHVGRLRLSGRGPQVMGVVGVCSLILVVGAACSSAAADLIATGTDAYEAGDYNEALEAFRRAAAADPGRPGPHYNAGTAPHQRKDYEPAASETVRRCP